MAEFLYTPAKQRILTQNLHLVTGAIKAMLVTTGYTPDREQQFIDDGTVNAVSEFEVQGTGYAAGFGASGRHLLTSKSFLLDADLHVVRYIFADLSWVGINVGIVGGVVLVLESGGGDSTSPLIAYRDTGGFPQDTDGSELRILVDQDLGFFKF